MPWLLLGLLLTVQATAAPAALQAGLASALNRLTDQAPGCVAAVAHDGERAVLARGQADL